MRHHPRHMPSRCSDGEMWKGLLRRGESETHFNTEKPNDKTPGQLEPGRLPGPPFPAFLESPGCCGSVGRAQSHKVKGHRFDSWSGHLPGLWVRSPVRVPIEGTALMFSLPSMFLSLSPFLPPTHCKKKKIPRKTTQRRKKGKEDTKTATSESTPSPMPL